MRMLAVGVLVVALAGCAAAPGQGPAARPPSSPPPSPLPPKSEFVPFDEPDLVVERRFPDEAGVLVDCTSYLDYQLDPAGAAAPERLSVVQDFLAAGDWTTVPVEAPIAPITEATWAEQYAIRLLGVVYEDILAAGIDTEGLLAHSMARCDR